MKNWFINSIIVIAFFSISALAQKDSTAAAVKPDKTDLRWSFSEDGTRYIKFTGISQTWIRETLNNPGTTVNGHPEDMTFDIGMRRVRFQVIGQLSDRILFYAQFGMNNFSFMSERKFGFFIHDALGEYTFVPKILSFGAGLSSWKGPLRYSAPGVASFMGLDPPVYQQVTNDLNDQFVRNLMIYVKGKIGKLDYRVSLGKPFIVNNPNNPTIPGGQAGVPLLGSLSNNKSTFTTRDASPQISSYFSYQFFDQEANQLAYNTGTYHGSKKIFNIGGGLQYQNNATWNTQDNGKGGKDTVSTPLIFGGLDVFYDSYLNKEKGDGISIYAAWLYSNYGPNYIRNLGVMNPSDASAKLGQYGGYGGNSFPMNGTGNTFSTQIGYKFKNNFLGSFGTLMPYASFQASKFQLLNSTMVVFDIGLNWLIKGHNSKFTFDYQNRPIYDLVTLDENGRRGMFILQYQISF